MHSLAIRRCAWHVSGCEPLHHLLQQAALDALCGATSAADLLGDRALLLAWKAAAVTLRHCCKVMWRRLALHLVTGMCPHCEGIPARCWHTLQKHNNRRNAMQCRS